MTRIISLVAFICLLLPSTVLGQYCANGNLNAQTCGCNCPDMNKYSFNGFSCYCDYSKLVDPTMLFTYMQYDAANGCKSFCYYGNATYDWWCGVNYGAVWSVSGCGCKCVAPKVKNGGRCTCPTNNCTGPGQVQNPDSCACECQSSIQTSCQTQGRQFLSASCSCGGCIAPKIDVGGICQCQAAPANSTQDSSCAWSCNSGYSQVGQVCYKRSCTDACPSSLQESERMACLADCELQ